MFEVNTWGWAPWDVAPWPAVGPAIVMVRPNEWSLNPRIYYWRTTRARPAGDSTAPAGDSKYFSYLILRDKLCSGRCGVWPVSSVQTVQWWNSTRPSPGQVWPAAVLQCCSAATVPVLHTPAAAPLRLPHTNPALIDNLTLSQLPQFTIVIAFGYFFSSFSSSTSRGFYFLLFYFYYFIYAGRKLFQNWHLSKQERLNF